MHASAQSAGDPFTRQTVAGHLEEMFMARFWARRGASPSGTSEVSVVARNPI
jgi:hypothetical protein